jgi:tetratricopeptide (TPR) repeat protein
VLGDQADLAALRATSGRTEEEILDALDALVGAAVLSEQRGAYRFVHPLVAAVVAQDLTTARRAFLHRRAAQALERVNAHRLEQVALPLMEHYAAAGVQLQAAHYAELAAEQAFAVGAFAESAAYARRAVAWQATPQRHFLVGNALAIAGAAAEARAELEQSLSDFEQAGDVVGMMRAGVVLARMSIATGQPDQARNCLARLPIEHAETLDPALGVQARLLSAGVDRLSRAFDAAEAQLNHADRLIRARNLPFQAALSAFERGNLLANRGELQAAIAAYGESLRIAQAVDNPMQQGLAHNNLAYHHLLLGDLEAALRHIGAAIALAEQFALGFQWQYLYSTAGEIASAQGRLDDADAAFAQALEAARAWNNRAQIANIHVNQAIVARARHDLPQARALLHEAEAVFGTAVDPFVGDKIARYRDELA